MFMANPLRRPVLGLILLQKGAGTLSLQALLAMAPEISAGGLLVSRAPAPTDVGREVPG